MKALAVVLFVAALSVAVSALTPSASKQPVAAQEPEQPKQEFVPRQVGPGIPAFSVQYVPVNAFDFHGAPATLVLRGTMRNSTSRGAKLLHVTFSVVGLPRDQQGMLPAVSAIGPGTYTAFGEVFPQEVEFSTSVTVGPGWSGRVVEARVQDWAGLVSTRTAVVP